MSLWICEEHGTYGGTLWCPSCGKNGSRVTKIEFEPFYWIYRQDDNGNEFRMDFNPMPKEEAEKKVKELETKGHKQVYYIKEVKSESGWHAKS